MIQTKPLLPRVVRYAGWNLAALTLPLAVGLLSIPYLLSVLGPQQFGLLTLFWAIVGYFSLFDFGIAKALTRQLAARRSTDTIEQQRTLIWTGLLLLAALGLLGWLLLSGGMLLWLNSRVEVGSDAEQSMRTAALIVAASVPLVVVSAGLRGALEGYERFAAANIIRLALGIWMFAAPAAVFALGAEGLVAATIVLVLGRVAAAVVSWRVVGALLDQWGAPAFSRLESRRLLSYGGWVTVSAVVGPLMAYLDRFAVVAIKGAAAVAFYATPQDVALKLLFVPIAINAALMPVISRELGAGASPGRQVVTLLERAIGVNLAVLGPLCIILIVFSENLLGLWLGVEFAGKAKDAARLFAAGALVNSVGIILVAYLYAANKPKYVAVLHLVEFPMYLVLSVLALRHYDILGAALVWFGRIVLDAVVLWSLAAKDLPELGRWTAAVAVGMSSALALSLWAAYSITATMPMRLAASAFAAILICALAGFLAGKPGRARLRRPRLKNKKSYE